MIIENQLQTTTPEAEGLPSSAVLAFIDHVEAQQLELHSLMLLRRGNVIAQGWWQPYGREIPHMLFSLSKSFTSTAVGLAVSEGRLSVDDPVLSFFPEDAPAQVSKHLAAMKVRHLLTMSTGHAQDAMGPMIERGGPNWVRGFLSTPVEKRPGSLFVYNSAATYMLSAIVTKRTGMRVVDYLQPRLFDPLGIPAPTWQTCPAGIDTGGWGLNLRTEDIARFGQLYLQKGLWNGQRILPEAWVEEATSKQISNRSGWADWRQGYGYQFWRCQRGNYRGDGAFGQFCVVMPKAEAVLAITSAVRDMQAVLTLVWKDLLAKMKDAPLPENPSAQAALTERLAGLALLPPIGTAEPAALEAALDGKTFHFPANELDAESACFTFTPDAVTLTVQSAGREAQAVFGRGQWRMGSTWLFATSRNGPPQLNPQPCAASAVWVEDDTLLLTLRHYETPFNYTVRAQFTGDQVTVEPSVNVSFGPTELPALVGQA